MDYEFTKFKASSEGPEAALSLADPAQYPLQQLGGPQIKWVLETADYDLVQASMVLSVPVNDLRRWMEEFDPPGTGS